MPPAWSRREKKKEKKKKANKEKEFRLQQVEEGKDQRKNSNQFVDNKQSVSLVLQVGKQNKTEIATAQTTIMLANNITSNGNIWMKTGKKARSRLPPLPIAIVFRLRHLRPIADANYINHDGGNHL